MLRPLIEAAGYRIIDDTEDDETADVVIACLGEELPEDADDRTIWLRTEPEAAGKTDNSIYRYDRAGLLTALKSVSSGRNR
jgi:two-component system chemotaxis sensor kinase CheA